MKIEYEQEEKEILASNIAVGTTFSGRIGEIGGLFLRAYDRIILLDNPQSTWNIYSDGNPTVHDYVPREVTLLVHK